MEESNGKFVSNEKVQAGIRKMAVVLFSVGFAIAYWIWPAGITDIPLGQITLGAFL